MGGNSLEAWVRKLTRHNMPVVGQTIAELNAIAGNDDADVNQLAEVILRDPNLTSHVLRIANSVHYNYSKFPINTVSRAVVLIGLKGMRAVCISLLLIDSLLSIGPKQRVLQLMAQGLHAATQARELIKLKDDEAGEEVFIAALLFNLGEMAFLAHEKITDANRELLHEDPKVRKEAMENILGTSFKSITRSLAKHWKLGDTLEKSLYPGKEPGAKVEAVVIGERMSRAALQGWDSPAVKKVLEEMARYSYLTSEQSLQLAQDSAEKAAEVALQFGAVQACPLIPGKAHQAGVAAAAKSSKVLKGDAQLQLNILRELSAAASEKIDINMLFQMVIEGMHRGIGLERVAIAFVQNHRCKAKYMLGEGTETWRARFDFDVGPYSDNIFVHATEVESALWLDPAFIAERAELYSTDIIKVVGKFPALVCALRVNGRVPAIFYADRADFGGKITQDQFEAFRHFAAQAQLNLNILSSKK